jgi:hypothetical protein
MSAEERLELWREERDRVLGLIASDPADSNGLNDVLLGDVIQMERFIRHYEEKIARKPPTLAGVNRLHINSPEGRH